MSKIRSGFYKEMYIQSAASLDVSEASWKLSLSGTESLTVREGPSILPWTQDFSSGSTGSVICDSLLLNRCSRDFLS